MSFNDTNSSGPQYLTNRPTATGMQTPTYDAAGDMLSDGTGTGTHTYQYDAEGRMTSGAGVTYTYDGEGERVKKSTGTLYWRGAEEVFLFAGFEY